MSLNASALWHAKTAWALAMHGCKDLTWVLTWEWAFSIHVAKTNTWALTWEWALSIHVAKTSTWVFTLEWALVRDTTVVYAQLSEKKSLSYVY